MALQFALLLLLSATIALALLCTLRLRSILPPRRAKPLKRPRTAPARILVVLGSGGHTAEMLAMLASVDMARFAHRTYVVSSGDALSADKARAFEEDVVKKKSVAEARQRRREGDGVGVGVRGDGDGDDGAVGAGGAVPLVPQWVLKQRRQTTPEARPYDPASFDICTLPRARRVHQPLLTTPLTSLQTLVASLELLLRRRRPQDGDDDDHHHPYPDVIVTNGPGTGVIVVLASVILRFFDVGAAHSRGSMRTVYVESWARVRRLSLSGRLLLRVVDRFLVQWEGLEGCGGGRGEYRGVLVGL